MSRPEPETAGGGNVRMGQRLITVGVVGVGRGANFAQASAGAPASPMAQASASA